MHLKPQGRHRPAGKITTKAAAGSSVGRACVKAPQARRFDSVPPLPLIETWETMRTRYPKPSRWAWLTKLLRR